MPATETRPALAPSARPLAVVDEAGSAFDREVVEVIEYRGDAVLCLIQRNGIDREILVKAVELVDAPPARKWTVTVSYDGHTVTQNVMAASAIAAITTLADWLAISVDSLTTATATAF